MDEKIAPPGDDVMAINPLLPLRSRPAASHVFRMCATYAVYTVIADAAVFIWISVRLDELELPILILGLASAFIEIMLLLWLRARAGFWSAGLFVLWEAVSGIYGMHNSVTLPGVHNAEQLLCAAPSMVQFLLAPWALRAFLFLTREGGKLDQADAYRPDLEEAAS